MNSVVSFPKASQSLTAIAAISVISSYALIFLLLTKAEVAPIFLIAGTVFCLVFIQSLFFLAGNLITYFQQETLNLITYLLLVHLGLELASLVPIFSSALHLGYLVFGVSLLLACVHKKSNLLFSSTLLHAVINLYLGFIFEQVVFSILLVLICSFILHKPKRSRPLSPFRFYSLFILLNLSLGLFIQQLFSFSSIESFLLSICGSYLVSPRKGISLFISALLLTFLTTAFTVLNINSVMGMAAPVLLGFLLLTIGYKENREMVLVLGWFTLFAGAMLNVIPHGIAASLLTLILFLFSSLTILLFSKRKNQIVGTTHFGPNKLENDGFGDNK